MQITEMRSRAVEASGGALPKVFTVRYATHLPLEANELRPEVSEVWEAIQPQVGQYNWDEVRIEAAHYPLGMSFPYVKGMIFVYSRTPVGWLQPGATSEPEPFSKFFDTSD